MHALRTFVQALDRIARAMLVVLCVGACAGGALAAPGEVELVLSDNSALYTDTARDLRTELGAETKISQILSEAFEARAVQPPAGCVTVALGTRALTAVLARDPQGPVISVLVPRKAYESALRAVRAPPRAISAVYLDQPYARQLGLIRLMLPARSRVGTIAGPDWEGQMNLLQNAARELKLSLVHESVSEPRELHPALQKVLGDADVLLALPDPAVFNANTLPNVLLTTYRKQQPVIGFSPAYVRAGALAAVYSTPQQSAKQGAELVQRALAGAALPAPQYPRNFWVSVNATVARSLDLKLADEAVLVAELQKQDRE